MPGHGAAHADACPLVRTGSRSRSPHFGVLRFFRSWARARCCRRARRVGARPLVRGVRRSCSTGCNAAEAGLPPPFPAISADNGAELLPFEKGRSMSRSTPILWAFAALAGLARAARLWLPASTARSLLPAVSLRRVGSPCAGDYMTYFPATTTPAPARPGACHRQRCRGVFGFSRSASGEYARSRCARFAPAVARFRGQAGAHGARLGKDAASVDLTTSAHPSRAWRAGPPEPSTACACRPSPRRHQAVRRDVDG